MIVKKHPANLCLLNRQHAKQDAFGFVQIETLHRSSQVKLRICSCSKFYFDVDLSQAMCRKSLLWAKCVGGFLVNL